MSYQIAYETLMEIIPNREISRFKALLAGYKSLELVIDTESEWTYYEGWDILTFDVNDFYKGVASDFTEKLSDKMFIYDNIVVFLENKGPSGWCNPKVKVVSLCKGYIRFNYDN